MTIRGLLLFYFITTYKMLVKLKEDGNFIEVYKSNLGYYYSLNSKNKTKKYKRTDLIFITYF